MLVALCKWSILGLCYDVLGDGQADACRIGEGCSDSYIINLDEDRNIEIVGRNGVSLQTMSVGSVQFSSDWRIELHTGKRGKITDRVEGV